MKTLELLQERIDLLGDLEAQAQARVAELQAIEEERRESEKLAVIALYAVNELYKKSNDYRLKASSINQATVTDAQNALELIKEAKQAEQFAFNVITELNSEFEGAIFCDYSTRNKDISFNGIIKLFAERNHHAPGKILAQFIATNYPEEMISLRKCKAEIKNTSIKDIITALDLPQEIEEKLSYAIKTSTKKETSSNEVISGGLALKASAHTINSEEAVVSGRLALKGYNCHIMDSETEEVISGPLALKGIAKDTPSLPGAFPLDDNLASSDLNYTDEDWGLFYIEEC